MADDSYDRADNAAKGYSEAIDAIRLEGVRAGRFLPLPDRPNEIKASPIVTDVRQIGPALLYCGDSTRIVPLLANPGPWLDACVTDPPYELGFMGKAWDSTGVAALWQTWGGVRIALKPGGHLVAFAGSRTYHRIAKAIDDAGFEVRDQVMWIYGSGFPKSLDISKAIDKRRDEDAAAVRREVILTVTEWIREARDVAGLSNRAIDQAFGTNGMAGHWTSGKSQPSVPTADQWPLLLDMLGVDEPPGQVKAAVDEWLRIKGQPAPTWSLRRVTGQHDQAAMGQNWRHNYGQKADLTPKVRRDEPATADAARWNGWGTALKPAHEPVCFARKPLAEATVAANVLRWATGAINIDGARVGYRDGTDLEAAAAAAAAARVLRDKPGRERWAGQGAVQYQDPAGSLAHWNDKADQGRWPANVVHDASLEVLEAFPPSARDAIRFFYAAKAGKDEREEGLVDAPVLTGEEIKGRRAGSAGTQTAHSGVKNTPRANHHPTVKPVDLMRWLCRLVTPPGGTVLDPFMGSGSTGIAAVREGFRFVGVEQDPDYFDIASRRIAHAVQLVEQEPDLVREITKATKRIRGGGDQGSLF